MLRPLAAITAFMLVPAAALAQEPVIQDQQQRDTVQMQQDTLRQQQQDQQYQQDQQRQQQVEQFEGRLDADAEFRGPARVGEPHFGLSRENVRELQMELNRMGCNAGPVDGLVGPLTNRGMACAREQLGIQSQDPNALFHALNLGFMRDHRDHNEQLMQQQRGVQQPMQQPVPQQPQPQQPVPQQPQPQPQTPPQQPPEQTPQPTPPQPQPPR